MNDPIDDYSRQSSTATQLSTLSGDDLLPSGGSSSFWKQFIIQQFHYSKFCTCHKDWRLFVHSPWLPQKWSYQLIYVIYRLAVTFYFICWFIASAVVADILHDSRYPIFITYWSFMLLMVYLIYSAIITTGRYIQEHYFKKSRLAELQLSDLQDPSFKCVCGCQSDSISWYLQIQWILFVVTAESTLLISVVYWMTFDGQVYSWAVNLHEHCFILLPGLIDLFFSGIPIRFYQFIYLMIFNSIYGIFTGIYFAAGGTNTEGEQYIYSTFNYKDRPVFSSFAIIAVATIIPFILHLIYWGLYLLRTLFLTLLIKKRTPPVDTMASMSSNNSKNPVL